MIVMPIELPAAKRVKHLTLLREARNITPREFNALSREERLELVRRAQGRYKYRLLLEAADIDALVPQLPAQEVYLLIRELGFEEAAEIMPLVSSDQFTTFLDLDCWRGDLLDGSATFPWLQALFEAGEEKVLATAVDLDFELLVLVLKKHLEVVSGPEDIEDEDARAQAQQRDGGYQFAFRDPEQGKLIAAFLDILLRHDLEFFRELVEAIRWEGEAILEENVYTVRRHRLEDRGFPDPVAARVVYAWLDPERFDALGGAKRPFASGEEAAAPPGFFLAAGQPRDLLAEVLAGGIDESTTWELAFLVNKVLVADGVDVGELGEVQAATESVYRNLNLALEYFSENDSARAARLLGDSYLEELFRLGYSLTLRLQRRAIEAAGGSIGPYLAGPYRGLVDALRRPRPLLFEGLERPDRGGERPFSCRRDLTLAESWLNRLEIQRQLFEERLLWALPEPAALDLSGCLPDTSAGLALPDFFLTALANRLLGRKFAPDPVPVGDLGTLHRQVCQEGRLAPGLREETWTLLEGLVSGAGGFADECLDRWDQEFCPLPPDRLDPRFIGGLIVRLKSV